MIKVGFTDFWHDNSKEAQRLNPIYQLLSGHYDIKLSDKPDFIFYSNFGKRYLKYKCTRVFFTGENVRPDFGQCDYAFSFDYPVTERNYRLPLYRLYTDFDQLPDKGRMVPDPSNQKFCNFIYSNKKAPERVRFFHQLCNYKHVDSGGAVLNNIGGRVTDKSGFLSQYKFTIAFENSSYPGYTTEKILEALVANTIPIYWGNPLVARDFNPNCYINCHDFNSFDEVIERVREVDQDDSLYRQYITAPVFSNGVDNEFVNEESLKQRFDTIFSGPTQSGVAWKFDLVKYWLHPSRPKHFAAGIYRRWKQKHR